MKWAIFAALLAGCFPSRSAEFACSTDNDCESGRTCEQGFCVVTDSHGRGGGDGLDPPDSDSFDCTRLTSRFFAGCDIPRPTGALEISGTATYDTDTATLTGSSPAPASMVLTDKGRVISVDRLVIPAGATLRVIGSQPLLIASWSTAQIDGTIDASSTLLELGAGSNPQSCGTHAPTPGQNNVDGAGGGGGGSFAGAAGRGGNGDHGAGGGSAGGAGGVALTTTPLIAGGCPGAPGGTGRQAGGAGGPGGGAIAVVALDSITLGGGINTGGSGGDGSVGNNGAGGGGGAGGMIALDSAAITVTGTLAANGGGGGSGSNNNDNSAGKPGSPGGLTATRATGGTGGGGGNGGTGGAGTTLIGAQGQDDDVDAGGGGGGSTGFILISSTAAAQLSGVQSPTATIVPR
jgi:hypothetical protein